MGGGCSRKAPLRFPTLPSSVVPCTPDHPGEPRRARPSPLRVRPEPRKRKRKRMLDWAAASISRRPAAGPRYARGYARARAGRGRIRGADLSPDGSADF